MEAQMKAGGRVAVALAALAAGTRLLSLWKLHPLNWDEIEYFRASDWIRQGLVPYRDFWEHHTPLQWFLFAPVSALVRNISGADAIIAMRFAQLPLWGLAFYLLWQWMRNAGAAARSRWFAITVAMCSSFFMLAAVEFRVDVFACALYVLVLLLLQHRRDAAAGVFLCLTGFANLRLGPLLVATVLLAIGMRRAWRIVPAAAVTFCACSLYFVVTHSAADAFRSLWIDNYIGEKYAPPVPGMLLHRLAVPFGFQLIGQRRFVPESVDPATILLFFVGAIGMARAIATRWRTRDDLFFLALLEIVNIAFLARMKFLYNYHFEIVILLLLPFVALEMQRQPRAWLTVGLVALVAINFGVVVFRGKEADLRYQNLIMQEVDRRTPPDGKVFDGVGWAIHRRPAYRYWFLRAIVNVLESGGRFQTYSVKDVLRDPPAACISDYGTRVWLARHPDLRGYFTTHYLPVWRDLWLPGLSARLIPGESAQWIVPADGVYRLVASSSLASHPWFGNPIASGSYASPSATVDVRSIPSSGVLSISATSMHLSRGQRMAVVSRDRRPIGVFIIPVDTTVLFRQPPPGVDIDASAPPRTHIPVFE